VIKSTENDKKNHSTSVIWLFSLMSHSITWRRRGLWPILHPATGEALASLFSTCAAHWSDRKIDGWVSETCTYNLSLLNSDMSPVILCVLQYFMYCCAIALLIQPSLCFYWWNVQSVKIGHQASHIQTCNL